MNRFVVALIFYCSITVSAAADTARTAARLAILFEDPAVQINADLLVAELSDKPGLQLLERGEIARIYREQQLSAANRSPLELGKLLGVDGVLLLQFGKNGTNELLATRLIAVEAGVILDETTQPLATDSGWAKWMSAQLAPLFPKLLVLERDAVPISVVNLRAAMQSPESIDIETKLKVLTVRRLLREPELFVLERERMENLAVEKELHGVQASPFWNGSYLLEGLIDRDGYDPHTLTLHARLMAPKGGQVIPIEVAAPRTNLSALIDELAVKVASSLKLKPAEVHWNSREEADLFFDEANWAFRWSMYAEALAAAEASWALGKQTSEVAEMRAAIYRLQAAPRWRDYRLPTAEKSPPDTKQLRLAERALELCNEAIPRFVTSDQKPSTNWYVLSLHVLETTSDLLRHFYLLPQFQKGHEDDLAQIRSLARELVRRLKTHSSFKGFVAPGHLTFRVGDETGVEAWTTPMDLREIEVAKGSYWQEKPEDSIEIYRAFARSGELPIVRTCLTRRHPIGWTPADKLRVPALWTNFLQELCTSTNPLLRVEGQFVAYAQVRKDPALEPPARALLYQVAVENAAEFNKHGLAEKLREDIYRTAPQYGDRTQIRLDQAFRADFEKMIVRGCVEALATHLKSDSGYVPTKVYADFYNHHIDQTQAAELLELVKASQDRLLTIRATLPQNELNEWKRASTSLQGLRNNLERKLASQPQVALPKKKTEIPSAPPIALTNLLRVDRFWRMPENLAPAKSPPPATLQAMLRNNFFWIAVRAHDGSVVLLRVDPMAFQYESIAIPAEHFKAHPVFEVFGNYLYLASPAGVSRYDIAQKSWEKLVVPLESNPRDLLFAEVHGRIFVATTDTILELSPDGQTSEILASRRRNPPVNLLDRLPFFRASSHSRLGTILFAGPNDALRTVIDGKLYTQERGSKSWTETLSWPPSPNHARLSRSPEGLIYQTGNAARQSEWWLMRNDADRVELLLTEVPTNAALPKTWWTIPPTLQLASASFHFEKESLWMLAGDPSYEWYRNYEGSLRVTNGSHATLVRFEKNVPQPEVTPLWFELSDLRLHFDDLAQTSRPTPQGLLSMFPLRPSIHLASSGLIILAHGVPGFWLIPSPNAVAPAEPLPEIVATDQSADAALLLAAQKGDVPRVRDALARGAKVDARNDRTWTPLMLAAYARHREVVRLLIDKGANVNAKSLSEKGDFALSFAVAGGDTNIVTLLLDRGANIKARGGAYSSSTALFHAVARTNVAMAELLLARGADPNDECRPEDESIPVVMLRIAARRGAPELTRLLLSKGAAIDRRNENGETALHSAARNPSPEGVKILIENGAALNPVSEHGNTPLHYAAYFGRVKNVELLLAAGADASLIGNFDGRRYDAAEIAESRRFEEVAALIRTAQTRTSANSERK